MRFFALHRKVIRIQGDQSTSLGMMRERLMLLACVFAVLFLVIAVRIFDLGFSQGYLIHHGQLAETDIVTGGGPGLMEAANLGAKNVKSKSKSFGLHIDLPFETSPNKHLDITYHHKRFSSRLDEFMRISHAVIVTPGGVGTVLELLYTWQLIQVNHISKRPVILLGDMWNGLIEWMKSEPLKKRLMDGSDFDHIKVVQNIDDVVILLKPLINDFYKK
mgnify:CR=1 FL=1